jgi:hypothetical protein
VVQLDFQALFRNSFGTFKRLSPGKSPKIRPFFDKNRDFLGNPALFAVAGFRTPARRVINGSSPSRPRAAAALSAALRPRRSGLRNSDCGIARGARIITAQSSPQIGQRRSAMAFANQQFVLAAYAAGFDQLGVCFFVGAVLAVIVAAVALSGSRGKHLNDAFARFARQFRGTFRPSQYWGDTPAVSFEHNGSPALLDIVKGVGPRRQTFTQLTFAFRRSVPVEMEIGPEAVERRRGRFAELMMVPSVLFGGADEPLFRRCGVLASDSRSAVELLSRPLREDLVRFAESVGEPLRVYLTRDYLLVRMLGVCRDFGRMHSMAHVAFHVHDRLLLVVNQAGEGEVNILATDITGAAPAVIAGEVKCGVCNDAVTEDRVLCRRCRAPHHRDCWDYNRGCSVYACRETAYVRG